MTGPFIAPSYRGFVQDSNTALRRSRLTARLRRPARRRATATFCKPVPCSAETSFPTVEDGVYARSVADA